MSFTHTSTAPIVHREQNTQKGGGEESDREEGKREEGLTPAAELNREC